MSGPARQIDQPNGGDDAAAPAASQGHDGQRGGNGSTGSNRSNGDKSNDGGHGDQSGAPFWETKTLEEMTADEWELLCDGCGRCCLSKLEDIDTGALAFTCVGCTLLDTETGRCRDYANRFSRVSDCLAITPNMARTSAWLPASCAYVRIAQGRGLAWWHPLISGRPETVMEAGVSVAGRVISEDEVDVNDLEDHIANWPDDEPDDEQVEKAV